MAQEEAVLKPIETGWSLSLHAYLPDRPGSLAHLARMIARHDGNIARFAFNRAESPNRVGLRANILRATAAGSLLEHFKQQGMLEPCSEESPAALSDPDALLTMKVRLADRPGTLNWASCAKSIAARLPGRTRFGSKGRTVPVCRMPCFSPPSRG